MKYSKLEYNSLNIEETGTQFQSIEGKFGDIQNENLPFDSKIDLKFNLPEPFLKSKAKLTSFINVVFIPSWFMVINDDLKNLLILHTKFSQFWKINLIQKRKIITNYNLFYISQTREQEIINFDKSNFYIGKYGDMDYKGDDIKILDFKNYLINKNKIENSNNNLYLKHSKIVLDFSKEKADIIRIINFPFGGYYVSEKLRNAIEKERFTGMVFKEIEEVSDKIDIIY